MKWERQTSLFWAVLCTLGLVFAGTACTGDDQQQEQLEEDYSEEPAEYEAEGDEGLPADEMGDIEPAPMVMEPMEEPAMMDSGMDSSMDSGMPPSVAEGLDEPAESEDSGMDSEMPAPDSGSSSSFKYTIKRGDWLSKISGRVYGDVYKWHVIHQANSFIKNPDLIYPNDVIVVPITGPKSEEFARSYGKGMGFNELREPNHNSQETRAEKQIITATVEKGDSLSKIAKKLLGDAKAWKQIYELNKDKISDPDKIYAGQILNIDTSMLTAVQADDIQLQQLSTAAPL